MKEIPVRDNYLLKELLERYIKQEIISKEHVASILSTNNINLPNHDGLTLLHLATDLGDHWAVYDLLKANARLVSDLKGKTPLMTALLLGHFNIIKLLLDYADDDEIAQTDKEGLNPLHIAAMYNYDEIVKYLLEDPRFRAFLNSKSFNGFTPLDLAKQFRAKESAQLLADSLGVPISFSEEPELLDQNTLNPRLAQFLKLKGQNTSLLINDKGMCHGWAFLFIIYATLGKTEEFTQIRKLLAKWDLKSETLNSLELPSLLKDKYTSADEVFEFLVHHLNIAQFSTIPVNKLGLQGWNQFSRLEQYRLIADMQIGRDLRHLFTYDDINVNVLQLTELLSQFTQYPGVSIEFTSHDHTTSLYIHPNGLLEYFDSSSYPDIVYPVNSEELASYILRSMLDENEVQKDKLWLANIRVHKFYDKQEVLPLIEHIQFDHPFYSDSPNRLTPMHYAVMDNDIEKVKQAIAKDPLDFFDEDVHGDTPFHWAVRLKNKEIMFLFRNTFKFDQTNRAKKISEYFNYYELNEDSEFLKSMLEHKWIELTDVDRKNQNLLYHAFSWKDTTLFKALIAEDAIIHHRDDCQCTPLMIAQTIGATGKHLDLLIAKSDLSAEDIRGNTALNFAILYSRDKNTVKKLISPESLHHVNKKGQTPLMIAINENRVDIVKLLLKNGANMDVKDKQGKTVLDYVHSNPKIAEEISRIYQRRESLLFTPKNTTKGHDIDLESETKYHHIPANKNRYDSGQ